MAVLFCIPTRNICRFQFLYIVTNIWYYQAFYSWYSIFYYFNLCGICNVVPSFIPFIPDICNLCSLSALLSHNLSLQLDSYKFYETSFQFIDFLYFFGFSFLSFALYYFLLFALGLIGFFYFLKVRTQIIDLKFFFFLKETKFISKNSFSNILEIYINCIFMIIQFNFFIFLS